MLETGKDSEVKLPRFAANVKMDTWVGAQGWLGFNASGAPDTATGLSRHGREDARETRGEGHGRRHVRVALGSEQAAASIFFFS